MRHHITPFPSVAAGAGPFQVHDHPVEAGGCCAPPQRDQAGHFQTPLTLDSVQAMGIRAHEYGHLGLWRRKLVPELRTLKSIRRGGIHEFWIQGTLDVVVNNYMLAQGNAEIGELVLWEGGLPADLPRWVAAVEYVRAEGLSRASLMRLSLLARRPDFTADDIGLLDRAARRLAQIGTLPRRLQDLEYAQALRELQRAFGPESRNADHPCARFPSFGASAPAPPGRPRRLGARSGGSWGPMEILTPPLTRPGPATIGLAGGVFRAGYCGAFRFPHRALLPASDGRAFGLRRRRHGGTFLIDCSGSMRHHASHQDLTAVLEQAPGATVALYAGLPDSASGQLLIAARGGRLVERTVIESWQRAGNVIDGPALAWLNRQPAPRVWISDGEVTGVGDHSTDDLRTEAANLAAAGRVRRFARLEDYFAGLGLRHSPR